MNHSPNDQPQTPDTPLTQTQTQTSLSEILCAHAHIIEELTRLQNLAEKIATLDDLIADLKAVSDSKLVSTTPMYSIKQVCLKTGLSRYRLHALWEKYKLPIPEPARSRGKLSPRYSAKDIALIRKALGSDDA